ncbi:MAG: cyclopropane fatty acyl phospholipid synthase [Candidatus Kerfeldbacteria bacterium]|nr:cyclopropane fatty acyl phospholipid synthase [Candidatus Kerfeldbacteria bacterium]
MKIAKDTVQHLLALADIRIGGDRPWDIAVHDERFYERVLAHGSLGLGESYMDGWWDSAHLDEFFTHVLRARLDKKVKRDKQVIAAALWSRIANRQSYRRAFEIGERHYDLGNDLYQAMLDARLTYTCGYWKNATTLDDAQEAKLELVCKKLNLQRGQRVLDIGCGWGSFAKYAAERYGVSVVGITVSDEQLRLAQKLCKGLPIELRYQDYRDAQGSFDHVVSLGMFEHVGVKNYRTYMKVASRMLKDDGLFLLQTIGGNTSVTATDPWISKYIFPNSMLPSIQQIAKAIERIFVVEDWHNFSAYYDKTLMAWYHNVVSRWDTLRARYDERFFRMWTYYLLSCAGTFRSRQNQLWQIVLSKNGVAGGYESIR